MEKASFNFPIRKTGTTLLLNMPMKVIRRIPTAQITIRPCFVIPADDIWLPCRISSEVYSLGIGLIIPEDGKTKFLLGWKPLSMPESGLKQEKTNTLGTCLIIREYKKTNILIL